MLCRGIIRRHTARLTVVALCAAAAFLAYIGISSGGDSVRAAMDGEAFSLNGVSLIVESEELPSGELQSLADGIDGVSVAAEIYKYTARGTGSDGQALTVRFFGYGDSELTRPVREGEGNFLLSFGYAADFDSSAVESITLAGGKDVTLDGVAYMPWHTSVYTDKYTASTDKSLVDAVCSLDALWSLTGERAVNSCVLSVREGADVSAVKDALLEDGRVRGVTLAEEHPSYKATSELGEVILKVCALFPVVLLVTGMIFICVFLWGVSERSRESVSVLLADGESRWILLFAFASSGALALLAGLCASLVPSYFLSRAISTAALENLGLPSALSHLSLRHVLFCLGLIPVISVLCAAGGLLFTGGRNVRKIMKHTRTKRTSAVSDILTVALCSGAAMVLVIVTLMYRDSQSEVRRELFEDRFNYDVQVIYSDFIPSADVSYLESCGEGVSAYPAVVGCAVLSRGEESVTASGVGISSASDALIFRDGSGERLFPRDNAIVLSRGSAEALGAGAGDVISVAVNAGSREIRVTCTVSAVSAQSSAYTELFSIETLEAYLDSSGVMNCAFVKTEGDVEEFVRRASSLPDVYAVQTVDGARERFDSRYSGTDRLISLIIGDGIMLSMFIFMLMGYRTWRRNLKRNRILVMLGESPVRLALKDAAGRLAGAALGLLAGYAASKPVGRRCLEMLSTDSVSFPTVMRWESVCFAAGVTLTFALMCGVMYASGALRRRA